MSNLATACSAQRQVCCRAQILEGLKKKAAPNSPKNYMYVYPLFSNSICSQPQLLPGQTAKLSDGRKALGKKHIVVILL